MNGSCNWGLPNTAHMWQDEDHESLWEYENTAYRYSSRSRGSAQMSAVWCKSVIYQLFFDAPALPCLWAGVRA
jgi:hypothetical protein